MEVRAAERSDVEAVREVSLRSMQASYTLSPQTIEGAVKQWYDDEAFEEKLNDPDAVLLIAEEGGEVRGFSEAVLVNEGGDGDMNWLHVDPDYRGEGIARRLFDETRERLTEKGAERMRGRVLRNNTAGNEFYEHMGFIRVADSSVEIDDTEYVENIYVESEPEELEPVTIDGQELYIDYNDSTRATIAPFLAVYTDTSREDRYGYYCANCESTDIAVDTMGRIECNECGNTSKAQRWDAAYL